MLAEKVKRLHESGMSYRNIAKELGETPGIVYGFIKRGYKPRRTALRADVDAILSMRKKGVNMQDIADELGVSINCVHYHSKDVKVYKETSKDKAMKMFVEGYSVEDIAMIMGVKPKSVTAMLKNTGFLGKEHDKQLTICLRMDGYYIDEVADIVGINRRSVWDYTTGIEGLCKRPDSRVLAINMYKEGFSIEEISKKVNRKPYTVSGYVKHLLTAKEIKPKEKPKVKPKKIKMKKEVKQTVSAIEQREMLGKGIESGTYSLEIRLRSDRDDGILLGIVYRDFGGSIKKVQIRVNDIEDKESRAKKWCDKHKKKYVSYF